MLLIARQSGESLPPDDLCRLVSAGVVPPGKGMMCLIKPASHQGSSAEMAPRNQLTVRRSNTITLEVVRAGRRRGLTAYKSLIGAGVGAGVHVADCAGRHSMAGSVAGRARSDIGCHQVRLRTPDCYLPPLLGRNSF